MDAHEREAVAAMTAERPLAIGGRVKGYVAGRVFVGTLVAVNRDRCDVEVGGAWICCRRRDLERDTED